MIKKKLMNKKVVLVIFSFALFVFTVTFSLQRFEISQQKPRVMKGVEQFMLSLADERYNTSEFWELMNRRMIELDGMININYLDSSYVNQNTKMDIIGSKINYNILRDESKKEMSFDFQSVYLGAEFISGKGYLNQEELFVKIPEIHPDTFVMSTHNIKHQYESSLVYKLLGKNAPQFENEFSIDGFPEIEIPKDIRLQDYLDDYIKSNKEILVQVYDNIQIEKLDSKRELFVGDTFRLTSGYFVRIPNEEAIVLLKPFSNYITIDEDMKFILFLDQDKVIRSLKTDIIFNSQNGPKKVNISADFIGEEYAFDEVNLTIHLLEDDRVFKASIKNTFEDILRHIAFDFMMEKPYQTNLLSLDVDYSKATGESQFIFDVNIPEVLVGDGSAHLELLKEEIIYPKETPIEIFQLDIISLLKLVNDLNLSYFQ